MIKPTSLHHWIILLCLIAISEQLDAQRYSSGQQLSAPNTITNPYLTNTLKRNEDLDDDNDGIIDEDEGFCQSLEPKVIFTAYADTTGDSFPDLSISVPQGSSRRMIFVQIDMERDHTPEPYGDNWPFNDLRGINEDIPSLYLDSSPLGKYFWSYFYEDVSLDSTGEARAERAVKSFHSHQYYHFFRDGDDLNNMEFDFSDYPIPINSGDETSISVVVIENVTDLEFDNFDRFITSTDKNEDIDTKWGVLVDPSASSLNFDGESKDNLMLLLTSISSDRSIPQPNSWTTVMSNSVKNTLGSFTSEINIGEESFDSENDGISSAFYSITGLTNETQVSFDAPGTPIFARNIVSLRFLGCTPRDTDSDGIADYLDLDSDNDGCPDAIEGTALITSEDLDTDDAISGGVDENGIPIIANEGQDVGTSTNQYHIAPECLTLEDCNNNLDDDGDGFIDCEDEDCDCFPCGEADFDGDQVNDACDEDDDNDGILDITECPPVTLTITRDQFWTPMNGGDTINVQIGDVFIIPEHYVDPDGQAYDLRFELMTKFSSEDVSDFTVKLTPFICLTDARVRYNDHISYDISWVEHGSITPDNLDGEITKFEWAQITIGDIDNNDQNNFPEYTDVGNFVNNVGNLEIGDNLVPYYYPNGQKVYGVADLSFEQSNCRGCFVSGQIENFSSARLIHGVYGDRAANRLVNRLANWSFRIGDCPDYDVDGRPDYIDFDSDNDGCADAIEGSGLITIDEVSNDRLYGFVDTSGIPNRLPNGQLRGSSINEERQDAQCSDKMFSCDRVDIISFQFTDDGNIPTEAGDMWSENGYKMTSSPNGWIEFLPRDNGTLLLWPYLDIALDKGKVTRIEIVVSDFCDAQGNTYAYLYEEGDTSKTPILPTGSIIYGLDGIDLLGSTTLVFEIPDGTEDNWIFSFNPCHEMFIHDIRLCITDSPTEICDNGIDDDNDGALDCADEDLLNDCCCQETATYDPISDQSICMGDTVQLRLDTDIDEIIITGISMSNQDYHIEDQYELSLGLAGDYVVTAIDSCSGLSVMDTFNLSFIDEVLIDTSAFICTGNNFSLFGRSFDEAGNYEVPVENFGVCGTTFLLNLSFYDPLDESITDSICAGDELIISGVTYDAAGVYTQAFIDANGCTSERMITISTMDCDDCTTSFRDTSLVICMGDSMAIDEIFYSSEGSYTQSMTDQEGCPGELTVIVSFFESLHESMIETICIGDSVLIGDIYYDNSGLYEQNFIDTNGCNSTRTIQIIEEDCNPCEEQNITIDTMVNFCSSSSFSYLDQHYTTPGSYQISDTDQSGCPINILLNIEDLSAPITIDTTVSLCRGDEQVLYGIRISEAGSYDQFIANDSGCDTSIVITVSPRDCYRNCCNRIGNHKIRITKNKGKQNIVRISTNFNKTVVLYEATIPNKKIEAVFKAFSLIENNYQQSNQRKKEIIESMIKGVAIPKVHELLTNTDTHEALMEALEFSYYSLDIGESFEL